jgi:hypothetical protein
MVDEVSAPVVAVEPVVTAPVESEPVVMVEPDKAKSLLQEFEDDFHALESVPSEVLAWFKVKFGALKSHL